MQQERPPQALAPATVQPGGFSSFNAAAFFSSREEEERQRHQKLLDAAKVHLSSSSSASEADGGSSTSSISSSDEEHHERGRHRKRKKSSGKEAKASSKKRRRKGEASGGAKHKRKQTQSDLDKILAKEQQAAEAARARQGGLRQAPGLQATPWADRQAMSKAALGASYFDTKGDMQNLAYLVGVTVSSWHCPLTRPGLVLMRMRSVPSSCLLHACTSRAEHLGAQCTVDCGMLVRPAVNMSAASPSSCQR